MPQLDFLLPHRSTRVHHIQRTRHWICIATSLAFVACGQSSTTDEDGSGGASSTGGVMGGGGSGSTGGVDSGGGASTAGGVIASGGSTGSGGGNGAGGAVTGGTMADASSAMLRLPPDNGGLDYQLGGAYPPPAGVTIVSRDRTDDPAPGLYNVCYVNGYQVQPGEENQWDADLILRDSQGDPIIDADWNEMLLDISEPETRVRIATVIGDYIKGCANAGFDAVEIDNLDSYSRSNGLLTEDNAVAYMMLLSVLAHDQGLAIAQKNSTELLARHDEMGTDFAVAEECARYNECQDYIDVYGTKVLMIEYRSQDFDSACNDYGAMYPIVLRDLDLVPKGGAGYVYEGC